jgi:PAS domain-containing protein
MRPMLDHAHPELAHAEYVVFVDSSRRYLDCTEGVCKLLGYTREEILRKTIDDVSYSLEEVPKLFAQYLKAGRLEGEYVLQHKDRVPVPIRYQAFVFSDGCNAAIWEPVKDWRESYLAALLEIDPAKLAHKLEVALAAIGRARDPRNTSPQTTPERQVIIDAASVLNSMLRDLRRNTQDNR